MKEINLKEIAIRHMPYFKITEGVLSAMRDVCEEAIELCAENAIINEYDDVDEESIINTITQIK